MNDLTARPAGEIIEGSYTDINTLTIEIKALWQSALESELAYAVRLGRKLTEAKKLLEHGEWGQWIEQNLPFSQRKANMMMQIYENYGASQESLFGEINSQTFANLGISQAFALLSVPENEREEFVKETDAENLSVRELKKAIEERDAARKETEAQVKKAEALENDNKMLRQHNTDLLKKANEASETGKRMAEAEQKAADLSIKFSTEQEKAKKAQAEAKAAKEELEALKKNPAIPEETLKELERAAEEKAKKAVEESAAAAAAEMKARIEALEKQLKAASPEVTVFKTYFQELQETMNRVLGCIAKVRNDDAGTAEKLTAAAKAAVDSFQKKL